ncbi:excinuclease ABC subunit A [Spiroplasma sp. TIUS-1]|uniref:excinuclease ABC subunit UvrA n=1 Tax=Spiroplasma sp. TIUS-1 TaxID=216963 RepID=UPI00139877A7|nr:excinuclease ABC subunit UvrA [Spiroplasma sp. TIUS-1]QHX36190.1 excinuclease ABC subunit A [Spiroplasma sp. TIUS-1]
MKDKIIVIGAKEHNLKNINIEVPKNKLVVFTGVSGSGKSSLAFNTIYAEGERRYVESLSSFSRQFIKTTEKPRVDDIEGLSPAISIDQRTTSHNPRSTVGTATEIHDHLRLLWANIGQVFCINGHGEISSQTVQEIYNSVKKNVKEGDQIFIQSPIVRDKKGTHKDLFYNLKKENFVRVIVDGDMRLLEDDIELEQNKRHNIEIVVDRLIYKNTDDLNSRLFSAIEMCAMYSKGLVKIVEPKNGNKEVLYSTNHSCKKCGFMISNLEPNLFSFNKKDGACEECSGLGTNMIPDFNLIVPDKSLTINQGAIAFFKNTVGSKNIDWQMFSKLLAHYKISLDVPIENFTNKQIDIIKNGSEYDVDVTIETSSGSVYRQSKPLDGISSLIQRRYISTNSDDARKNYLKYMSSRTCEACKGKRLNMTALAVKIQNKSIADFVAMTIGENLDFLLNINLTKKQEEIASLVMTQLVSRISFLNEVGLSYLNLERASMSLSGGEAQRIRLAKQLGSKLSGVLYVLDEPSIGLHQKDNDKLIGTLKKLRDLGNTLIVVEHDEDTMKASDWIVDIGPGAGEHGGEITFEGTYEQILKDDKSLTGKYLSGVKKIEIPKKRRSGNGKTIEIKGARENNLKNVDVTIPLGKFISITGVSGSGKSTLLEEIIYKGVKNEIGKERIRTGKFSKITGANNVNKIIYISQDPIGRTPRSNPATYTSVFDDIRDLFTMTPDSKMRGYAKGRFSFNVPGGRCENCRGDGIVKIDMQFLGYVEIKCDVCLGRRYNEETLQVKYKGKNISDVLDMTIEEASTLFENIPNIKDKLDTLLEVGIGYIKLGQNGTTLSGGEAQRVKLSTHLLKRQTGNTLFLLDEPTTGLHIDDVSRLVKVLNKLVDYGNTVLTIEHNLDFIKMSDYIIDLGPDGGTGGGLIVGSGTPEQLLKAKGSYTAEYLEPYLKND